MTCFVYMMDNEGPSLVVKIGVSADPEKRLRQIRTACPSNVRLRASRRFRTRGEAVVEERSLHERLWDYCTAGEWFDLEQAPDHLIDHLVCRVWPDVARDLSVEDEVVELSNVISDFEEWLEEKGRA